MKPKHIVIEAGILGSSTGRYVVELLEQLQQIDTFNHYTVVLTPANFHLWESSSANFHKIQVRYGHYRISEQILLVIALYKAKPDLVHFTMPNTPILYLKKKIISVHDLTLINFRQAKSRNPMHTIKYWLFRFVIWYGVTTAKHVLTDSEFVKNQIEKKWRINKTKITTIHLAANKLTKKPSPYQKTSNYFLYVGNAFPYKNLRFLIDAFIESKKHDQSLNLVLAGKKDYWYDELESYVKKNKIAGVHFTGYVSESNLAGLYDNAIAFVFPSLSEGFGLPGLEAFVYDCPVVASNATCLPEIYGDAALYFDPLSKKSLIDALSSVQSSDKSNQLIAEGHVRLSEFSWNKTATSTLSVYRRVLGLQD